MRKSFIGIIAGLLIAAGAQATTYVDNNPADIIFDQLHPSYTGHFTLAGYDSSLETITSALAEFTFGDLVGSESFSVTMDGDGFVHGNIPDWSIITINLASSNSLSVLDSTGILEYTVTLTSNGRFDAFGMINAKLTAESAARSVPDAGATSLLLGLGVIAMIGARRRFASVA